ncbi:MAG: DUF4011 domain-containing protein [Candidatus Coatesbacteria bacterium]|nr:DUF4011 domain-containing protein [Candidatus Coatesbacteria bacterium]
MSGTVPDNLVLEKIENWKENLIDLSRRNRLLYFREARSTLRIEEPGCLEIFSRLVDKESPWHLWEPPPKPKDIDNADAPPNKPVNIRKRKKNELKCAAPFLEDLLRTLTNLYRRSETEYQEKGLYILNVVFGELIWKDAETSERIRSPLILIPVRLERKSVKGPYSLKPVGEDAVVNPALIHCMAKFFKIELPDRIDIPENEAAEALQTFLNEIRQRVKAREREGWSVEDKAFVSLLSFHKLVMYEDLNANAEAMIEHPFIRALATSEPPNMSERDGGEIPKAEELDTLEPPYAASHILDADSSQEVCIEAVRRGHDLIIQGPPGTGKSQTIANIIADFIANGKKVLFVSEKMAALEVVLSRLKEKGLHEFCLPLHSNKANKKEVAQELGRCLEERIELPGAPMSQDRIDRLIKTRNQLNDYVLALRESCKSMGLSTRDIMTRVAVLHRYQDIICELPQVSSLNKEVVDRFLELVRRIERFWDIAEQGDAFPWRGCTFERYSLALQKSIPAKLAELRELITKLLETSRMCAESLGLPSPKTIAESQHVHELQKLLTEGPGCERKWFNGSTLKKLNGEASRLLEQSIEYRNSNESLRSLYSDGFFDLPEDHGQKLKAAWDAVLMLSQLYPLEWYDLVKDSDSILEFLKDTGKTLGDWERIAGSLAKKRSLET